MNIRKPHVILPKVISENGFVRDLQTELQQAAGRVKLPLYAFKKEWEVLVRPTHLKRACPGAGNLKGAASRPDRASSSDLRWSTGRPVWVRSANPSRYFAGQETEWVFSCLGK